MTFDPQKNVARCFLDSTHRSGNSESRRVGLMSSPRNPGLGIAFLGQCKARLGMARQGSRLVWQGVSRLGAARRGLAWIRSRKGRVWRGKAWLAVVRFGKARGATLYTHTSSRRYKSMSA